MKHENLIDKVTEGLRKGIFIKNYSRHGDPIQYIPGNKIGLSAYKREINFCFRCIEYISPIPVKEFGESWGLSETDLRENPAEEVGKMKIISKIDDERKGLMSQEYTQYIVEHKANVEKAFRWIVDHNIFENCEIPVNIISHDLSKYSAEEYKAYDNYFYGERTKEVEKAFSYA